GVYLDDPLLLFIPVRLLLGVVTALATIALARAIEDAGLDGPHGLTLLVLAIAVFVVLFELVLPFVVVRAGPERVLGALLPSFTPIARALAPMVRWIARAGEPKRAAGAPSGDEVAQEANEAAKAYIE